MKILRIGILSEVRNLDPKKALDVDSMFVLRQILDSPFVEKVGASDPEPVLFEGPLEWQTGSGGMVLRAKVRQGIRFADGTPLSAQDLASTLANAGLVQEQARLRREGDWLIFELLRPNARFDLTLSHIECAVSRTDASGRICGTGPFQLSADSQPQKVRLVRNPHYWRPVALDEVHFTFFPVDQDGHATALREALEKGEIDLCTVLPRDEISRLSGVRKSFRPSLSTSALYLNTERGGLRDARVRRAIAHAVNRLEVAECCYENALAFKARSLLPPGMDPTPDGVDFDVEKARALLSEPGVHPPKELTLLAIWCPRPYIPHPRAVSQALKRQLAAIGIEVRIVETTNSSDFFRGAIEGTEDMVLAGWAADTTDPADFLTANLASDRIPSFKKLAVSVNLARFKNAQLDGLLARYRGDRRSENLQEIFELLRREAPLVPLIYGSAATVTSFRVLNFQPSPLSVFPVADLDLKA